MKGNFLTRYKKKNKSMGGFFTALFVSLFLVIPVYLLNNNEYFHFKINLLTNLTFFEKELEWEEIKNSPKKKINNKSDVIKKNNTKEIIEETEEENLSGRTYQLVVKNCSFVNKNRIELALSENNLDIKRKQKDIIIGPFFREKDAIRIQKILRNSININSNIKII